MYLLIHVVTGRSIELSEHIYIRWVVRLGCDYCICQSSKCYLFQNLKLFAKVRDFQSILGKLNFLYFKLNSYISCYSSIDTIDTIWTPYYYILIIVWPDMYINNCYWYTPYYSVLITIWPRTDPLKAIYL